MLFGDQIVTETLRYEKKSLLKKRQGPVAVKINRRNIEKEQSVY